MDGAVRGSVANVLGQMIGKPSAFKYENNFGRQFVYGYQYTPAAKSTTEAPPKPINFVVISRVLLVGKRQYQLTCLMERSIFDEQLAGKFLNSFKLAKTEQDTNGDDTNGEDETKSKK